MTPSDSTLSELEGEIRQRTHQAQRRLDEMNVLCNSYQSNLANRVVSTNENGKTYYKIPNMPNPPEEINVLVSEILHHLRSALDNLIVGLTVRSANHGLTDAEEKPISFPIVSLKSDFDSFQSKKLSLLNSEYVDLLYRLQPIDLDPDNDDDLNYWVKRALRDCAFYSNYDKHRRLPIVGPTISGSMSAAGPGVSTPRIHIGGVRTDEYFAWHETVPGHGEVSFRFLVYLFSPFEGKAVDLSQRINQIDNAIQSRVIPMFLSAWD